jgi:3-oxoacyl-[acyl-carrier-protein] synthase II
VKRSVCITGLGVVSAIGNGISVFADSLANGVSGIRMLNCSTSMPQVGGVVDIDFADFFPAARSAGLDRTCLLGMAAAKLATDDARASSDLDLRQAGVYLGTGIGGVATLEAAYEEFFLRGGARTRPLTVLHAMNNATAAQIALDHACHGPVVNFSTACASSALAIGEAMRAIRHGYANTILAGGAEALLTPGTIRSWEALRTLAIPDKIDPRASCRPFSRNRTGLVLAEGAAIVVLEELEHARRRGARIYALVSGYGCRNDATHLTKPDVQGQAETMKCALKDANLNAADIGYINAHGTATQAGDAIETQSIKLAFGKEAEKIPVSSTKSMHGHVMGATGAVEFIAAIVALTRGFAPPTINLNEPDLDCDLDYVPNVARNGMTLRHVMSNSFAFGGTNATLIASRQ